MTETRKSVMMLQQAIQMGDKSILLPIDLVNLWTYINRLEVEITYKDMEMSRFKDSVSEYRRAKDGE